MKFSSSVTIATLPVLKSHKGRILDHRDVEHLDPDGHLNNGQCCRYHTDVKESLLIR